MKRLSAKLLALIVFATTALPVANVTAGGAVTALDPAFTNELAVLKHAAGFIEQPVDDLQNKWSPHLQLWVGVKALEGKKQTLYFVQLTTMPPPASPDGQLWQPALRTQ